jgi:hypothetical protein
MRHEDKNRVQIQAVGQDTRVWDLITLGIMLTMAALAALWLLP